PHKEIHQMYFDESHKRSEVCKLRYKPEDMRNLRMEARLAGMQLATYIHDLSMLARRLGAAELIREMNGLGEQDKSA
ncbi:hypothetical protein, partial [Pseudomonas aeruginosa]|uniref:hypothetical protein n=2 Tax=Pseudomonas aeruginosa TaxID=287 RepID=UPI000450D807